MCFGRFKIQLTPLTKWPAIWIVNFSAISSVMQWISKRQNAAFQYHTQCHCNCLLQKHTLQSAGVTACVEWGCGPSHAHPIFLGAMGCYFVLGACKIVMLPSREILAWGEMQIMPTETVVEQKAVVYPCGWVISVVFSSLDNQVAKRNVLHWGCLWRTRCMICPGTNWVCLNTAARTQRELGENFRD